MLRISSDPRPEAKITILSQLNGGILKNVTGSAREINSQHFAAFDLQSIKPSLLQCSAECEWTYFNLKLKYSNHSLTATWGDLLT